MDKINIIQVISDSESKSETNLYFALSLKKFLINLRANYSVNKCMNEVSKLNPQSAKCGDETKKEHI